MTERLFSSSWYRVGGLKPRLQSHVVIHRQRHRGQLWYVIEGGFGKRMYRVSPALFKLVAAMDGQKTVQHIWENALQRLGEEAPTQDQLIELLCQLRDANVLQCDVPADAAGVLERQQIEHRLPLWQRVGRIFYWRLPIVDPDLLLKKYLPFVRPLFSWVGLLVWCVVVFAGLILTASHWRDLTENVLDRVFVLHNFYLLLPAIVLLKCLHELAHAFAVKVYGGDVHDMGVSLLFFAPLPYVDASAASTFREKRKRIVVGAAGMMLEVFLASLALFFWLILEPGLARAILYDVFFIAGVSTILFNANPLVRFDGYYILSDVLEVPSLRRRSVKYLGDWIEKHLFGSKEIEDPAEGGGEGALLALYGVLSAAYQISLLLAFGLWLSTKLRLAGLLFLAWAAVNWALVPFARVVQHLFASHRLRLVRARVLRVSFGSSLLLISMVCLVPFPLRTVTEGVVQPSEDGIVRPKSDVFIREILSSPGSRVRRGEALFACDDPLLVTHVKVLEAELAGLRARKDQAFQKDLVQAQILGAEIARREETLVGEKALLGDLILRSQVDGFFVVVEPEDLPGRFVKKGVAIGYVVDPQSVTARVVVPQAEIDAVRHRTDKVMVRFPARLSEVRQVNIVREVPAASNLLPSPALGTQGGGKITVSPSDNKGATTMEKVFQLDLELPRIDDMVPLNGKVFVRLNHGYEPLVLRWGRGIRRLFLSSFNV